jgi:hypothetical protein
MPRVSKPAKRNPPSRKQVIVKRQLKKGIALTPGRKLTLVLKTRPFVFSA